MASDSSITPEPNPGQTPTEAQAGAVTAAKPGLPPVLPPSGRHILQLFVVPGLIVACIIGFLLVVYWLFGGPRSPEAFLKKLDEDNPDVRWRTASDLAQTLLRDQRLASDGPFALQLALRLRRTLDNNRPAEQALAERLKSLSPEERQRERKPLEADRAYANFLCSCLGNFSVPAGCPLLKEVAGKERAMEPMAQALLRRQSVWALANLGQNLNRFDALSEPDQMTVLARLEEAARGSEPAAGWANETLRYLRNRRAKVPDAFGVDVVLDECTRAEDPELRCLAAYAMSYWYGTEAEDRRMEEALLLLARDDGHGEKEAELWFADNPNPSEDKAVVAGARKEGFFVRLNATLTLARRGSPKTPVGQLEELLDPDLLRRTFIIQRKDGSEHPDEPKVVETLQNTLKALRLLHEQRPNLDLAPLKAAVVKLADDPNQNVQAEARRTREALGW
jgi:hypothetical protein